MPISCIYGCVYLSDIIRSCAYMMRIRASTEWGPIWWECLYQRRTGIDRVPIWRDIEENRQMDLNDKRAYTKNCAYITKEFFNESDVWYVPAGIPKFASLFGTCRYKHSWSTFRLTNRGVVWKQALHALRHLRRSVRRQISANLSELQTCQNCTLLFSWSYTFR